MNDDRRSILVEYLNNNPEAATSIQASVSRLIGQINSTSIGFQGISAQLVSFSERLEQANKSVLESFRANYVVPGVEKLNELLDSLYPRNWPRPVEDVDRICSILEDDGIPLVHLPRAAIVQMIVNADDYEARIRIINTHADEIIDDCKAVLQGDYAPSMEKQVPLARRAVETYRAGYFEAAQALAVTVCDTYLKQLFKGEKYADMAKKVAIDASDDESFAVAFNLMYPLAPVATFLANWGPADGTEPPSKLSRHASIHGASVDHMNKLNATIAIMLLASMSAAINWGMSRKAG